MATENRNTITALYLTGEGRKPRFAFNLGLGLSSDLDRWALRPEVGIMSTSGGSGYFRHLSLGLAVATGAVD